jgi:hypothetical protein
MKLTSQQIKQLYKFTRQHYVEHFDVQTELVDHLANDIEQVWQEQPKLSFEQTRNISFKKFGVFGFMDVVEARQKALYKKYWKLVLGMFRDYFKVPQILTTLLIFFIIFYSFKFIQNQDWIYIILGGGICIYMLIRFIHLFRLKKKRFKKTGKKWLLEEAILNAGGIGGFSYLYFQIPLSFDIHLESNFSILLMAFFFTCFIVINYIIALVLPTKIEELLEKQYPEYKLV